MSVIKVNSSEFIGPLVNFKTEPVYPEFAIIGRSNAGKSTLLNRLLGRKALAKVSNTPGRTQEVNLFLVKLALQKKANLELVLADLPGYGYAALSKSTKRKLSQDINKYLSVRAVSGVVLVMDARREVEIEEAQLQELLYELEVPFIPVISKVDKLSKNEINKRVKSISEAFCLHKEDITLSGTGSDLSSLLERLYHLCSVYSAELR
jgi:GTP-binding protein